MSQAPSLPSSSSQPSLSALPPPALTSLAKHLSTLSRSHSLPPPSFSRARSSTPSLSQTQADLIEQSRVQSNLRLRSAWQDISHRHSRASLWTSISQSQTQEKGRTYALREDEDDIIDLGTMEVIQDRGVLRGLKKGVYNIGVFSLPGKSLVRTVASEDGDSQSTSSEDEEEGLSSDEDELGTWTDERALQLPSVTFTEARRKLDDAALDLRGFLEEDARERGIDIEETEIGRSEMGEAYGTANLVLDRPCEVQREQKTAELADRENNEDDDEEDDLTLVAVPSPSSLLGPLRNVSFNSSPLKPLPLRRASLPPPRPRASSSFPAFAPTRPAANATQPRKPSPLKRSRSVHPTSSPVASTSAAPTRPILTRQSSLSPPKSASTPRRAESVAASLPQRSTSPGKRARSPAKSGSSPVKTILLPVVGEEESEDELAIDTSAVSVAKKLVFIEAGKERTSSPARGQCKVKGKATEAENAARVSMDERVSESTPRVESGSKGKEKEVVIHAPPSPPPSTSVPPSPPSRVHPAALAPSLSPARRPSFSIIIDQRKLYPKHPPSPSQISPNLFMPSTEELEAEEMASSPKKRRRSIVVNDSNAEEEDQRTGLHTPPNSKSSPKKKLRVGKSPSAVRPESEEVETDTDDPLLFTPTKLPDKASGERFSTAKKVKKRKSQAVVAVATEESEDELGIW